MALQSAAKAGPAMFATRKKPATATRFIGYVSLAVGQ
jgi:hypothetical protein